MAAVGCALLVLAAAAVAREVADTGRVTPAPPGRDGTDTDASAVGRRADAVDVSDRAVVLTVVGTTALVSNASIDLVFAKGEVLSLPSSSAPPGSCCERCAPTTPSSPRWPGSSPAAPWG